MYEICTCKIISTKIKNLLDGDAVVVEVVVDDDSVTIHVTKHKILHIL